MFKNILETAAGVAIGVATAGLVGKGAQAGWDAFKGWRKSGAAEREAKKSEKKKE